MLMFLARNEVNIKPVSLARLSAIPPCTMEQQISNIAARFGCSLS
jgi:hypothetical protein